jgi:hypothetical protein
MTGIYQSLDGGENWQRSTPMPDDPGSPVPYAHFSNLFRIVSSEEIFATGWQGISRWSARDPAWDVQVPTQSYAINSIYAYPTGSPDWDVWAVGQSGAIQDRYRMIYHLIYRIRHRTGSSQGRSFRRCVDRREDGIRRWTRRCDRQGNQE